MLFCGDLTILLLGLIIYCLFKLKRKLRHSLRRPSRSDLVQFELDEILKSKLTLYPNETVTGGICRSGRNIVTSIAPVIKIEVSYIKGNTKEKIQFFRCICYTGTNDENVFMKCELEDISRKLNEISCSSNRMANYFEGRFFLKSDVINAYPSSSMYKDLKDAINKTEREEIKENTRDELGNLHIE